ncbi:cytochrome P450 family protein, partial [Nocardia tengchongensis]|uniref:hypothetical protein n=1 Tax=Nocardia tengchongensis TaxID=2055889 RepID=UPI003679EADD
MWELGVPAECPVRPMMESRPNAIRSAGADHQRYRLPITAALSGIDLHRIHEIVEDSAEPLIDAFSTVGHCDVVSQYAKPVTIDVLNSLLGCDPEISERAAIGAARMLDSGADAADGTRILLAALQELIWIKRGDPGSDITSSLIAHPVGLSDEEVLHQLVLLYAAGSSPPQNLITTALLTMLTDDRFGSGLFSGSLSTQDALDEVLFNDPPMANYCITYPRLPVLLGDVWLPAHQPVVISMAACNHDPDIWTGDLTGNRSHLAFGTGPHACPARTLGYLIAHDAIDQLLDRIPEMSLAVAAPELVWGGGGGPPAPGGARGGGGAGGPRAARGGPAPAPPAPHPR